MNETINQTLYPQNFETKLGFDKLRTRIKSLCLSKLGKEKTDEELQFSTEILLIKKQLAETSEFKNICLFEDSFPLTYFFDLRANIEFIKSEGAYLAEAGLFDFKRSMETIKSIVSFFKREKGNGKYLTLYNLTAEIQIFDFIFARINQILDKNGAIKNSASPELANIRSSLFKKQSTVSRISHKLLKTAQQDGLVSLDTSLSVRDGKMLIPLSSSNKRKIKGYVYDESATGKTVYIEPLEIIEVNNEIRELEFAEKREVIKILINFADDIRPYADEILYSYDFLATIDFIRAKALLSIELVSEMPQISEEQHLDLANARHPLLYMTFQAEKRKIIPLDLKLTSEDRILLISGPNAGGKSVCLKTVGILQYMVQCGLLIPVAPSSKMGIFSKIFIDIGDEQSIENDLSTYSSHLYNMKHFVENADKKTLILIDEFGTGTEPALGGAIAEAILHNFNKLEAFGVITTHYTNLKHFATSTEGIMNGAMLYNNKQLEPLYILETGKPGSSFAFEIAKKIGLDEEILKSAEKKIGKKHINFEKNLQTIERDKFIIGKQRRKIEQLEIDLEKRLAKYEKRQADFLSERKNILALANEEAKAIVAGANKKIEYVIREIKEANAEKEKTKLVRREVDELKEKLNVQRIEREEVIAKKIDKLHKKQQERDNKNEPEEIKKPEEKATQKKEIEVGDYVKLLKQTAVGEVITINKNDATVAFGNMQTVVKLARLEKISQNEAKKLEKRTQPTLKSIGWDMTERKDNFSFGIDVRGKRADEALDVVSQYIDEALVVGAHEVRILHGTGNGILRQLIRDLLGTMDIVRKYRDENIEFGGAGITIVMLDY